jgi:hypothetical protein
MRALALAELLSRAGGRIWVGRLVCAAAGRGPRGQPLNRGLLARLCSSARPGTAEACCVFSGGQALRLVVNESGGGPGRGSRNAGGSCAGWRGLLGRSCPTVQHSFVYSTSDDKGCRLDPDFFFYLVPDCTVVLERLMQAASPETECHELMKPWTAKAT